MTTKESSEASGVNREGSTARTEANASAPRPAKPDIVAVCKEPPRLNDRVYIGQYRTYHGDSLHAHAATIRKCGLTAEIVCEDGKLLKLYAARRRARNKHD